MLGPGRGVRHVRRTGPFGDDGDSRSQDTETSKPRKAWDGGPACGVGRRQEVGYLTAQPPGLLDPC